MNGISSVFRMHLRNRFTWILLPLLIFLVCSFGTNLIIAYFVEEHIYTGGLAAIHVYTIVLGATIVSDTFPFALGFSIRRSDYFLGTMAMLIGVSLLFTLLMLLLALIERYVIVGWGLGLSFFQIPYVHDGNFFEQSWISFSALTHLFMEGFVVSCLYYRFGNNGIYTFFATATIFGSVGSILATYFSWWGPVFNWIGQYSAFQIALGLFPITVVLALISYVLLLRATDS